MAPLERAPKQAERLRPQDREYLLGELTASGRLIKASLVYNFPHLDPWSEFLTIMNYLEVYKKELRPVEQTYLKKLAALETRRKPLHPKGPGDYQIIESLTAELGPLREKAQEFEQDLSNVSRPWQTARDGLIFLSEEIRKPEE